MLTVPLLLFGWVWSINHGGAIMDVSGVKNSKNIEDSMTTCQMIKYALSKLLYEMVGTYFVCLMFISTAGAAPFPIFMTFWIVTAFCIRVSGAHFNAAVSFAFSLRKDTGSISRKLAIWYMAFQCAGALLAGFTCIWIINGVPVAETAPDFWFRAMYQEIAGSFFFVFFFLSQTESKMVISEIETIHCFVLSASYMAARSIVCGNVGGISTYGAMINPSFAVGI